MQRSLDEFATGVGQLLVQSDGLKRMMEFYRRDGSVVVPTREEARCRSCRKRWTVSAQDCIGSLCVCPVCGAPWPVPRTPVVELIGTS